MGAHGLLSDDEVEALLAPDDDDGTDEFSCDLLFSPGEFADFCEMVAPVLAEPFAALDVLIDRKIQVGDPLLAMIAPESVRAIAGGAPGSRAVVPFELFDGSLPERERMCFIDVQGALARRIALLMIGGVEDGEDEVDEAQLASLTEFFRQYRRSLASSCGAIVPDDDGAGTRQCSVLLAGSAQARRRIEAAFAAEDHLLALEQRCRFDGVDVGSLRFIFTIDQAKALLSRLAVPRKNGAAGSDDGLSANGPSVTDAQGEGRKTDRGGEEAASAATSGRSGAEGAGDHASEAGGMAPPGRKGGASAEVTAVGNAGSRAGASAGTMPGGTPGTRSGRTGGTMAAARTETMRPTGKPGAGPVDDGDAVGGGGGLVLTARLGRAELEPGELRRLGAGSVVRLDSPAGEEVELLLGDCFIARGEVIVDDDHYAVRIRVVNKALTEDPSFLSSCSAASGHRNERPGQGGGTGSRDGSSDGASPHETGDRDGASAARAPEGGSASVGGPLAEAASKDGPQGRDGGESGQGAVGTGNGGTDRSDAVRAGRDGRKGRSGGKTGKKRGRKASGSARRSGKGPGAGGRGREVRDG